jgi:hypothetical protein
MMQALPPLVLAIIMAAALGPSCRTRSSRSRSFGALRRPRHPLQHLSLREQPLSKPLRRSLSETRIAIRHVLPTRCRR